MSQLALTAVILNVVANERASVMGSLYNIVVYKPDNTDSEKTLNDETESPAQLR